MGLGHTAGPPSYNHHPDHPGHDRNANDDSSSRFRTYGTTVTQIGLPETATWDKESDYPPRDRGRAAWLFLCGCFWLEGLVWGMSNSRVQTGVVQSLDGETDRRSQSLTELLR